MLIEKARALTANIKALENKQAVAGDAKKYSLRMDKLSPPVTKLKRLVRTFEEMQRRGIVVDIAGTGNGMSIEHLIDTMRTQLIPIRKNYESDAETIFDTSDQYRYGFWDRLPEFPDKLESALNASWSEHVKNTVNPLPDQIVSALATGSPGWAGLQTIYARIRGIRTMLPDVDLLDELDQLKSSEIQARKDLKAGDEFELIEPFILSAQDGKAGLEMVNPELVERLQEMDIMHLFQVHIGARNG